jgi:lipopolysaccharide heptosyltransferase II
MGDILLTSPLIRSIKNQNPSLQIDFVLKEEFFDLMKNNPYLTNIYKYLKEISEKEKLIRTLKSNNYDRIIDLQNNNRSRQINYRLRKKIFQFNKNNFKKFLLVHFKINRLKNAPQIPVRYAKAAGIKLDNGGLEIFTDNIADSRLELNKKYIGLCPGAKHFTKRWPKEYFIDLGKMLETSGYKVALFGSTDESETIKEIESQLGNALNLCSESILQTVANMKMCKAIYTNDSSTMHLSCAVDVPVIAFFGSTVKEFGFYPYKNQNVVLEIENLPCRPCTHIGRDSCPLKHFKCMKEIKPELAFNSLKRLHLS